MSTPEPLFQYFLFIRLQPNDQGEPEAVVEHRFPSGDLPKAENSLMAMITQFCFPDKQKFPKVHLSNKSKFFSFVTTNVEGKKRYGYCRRHLVGQNLTMRRWPVCLCILAASPSHAIFEQILEVATRFVNEAPVVLELIRNLESTAMPSPGNHISASITVGDASDMIVENLRFLRPENDVSLSGFVDFEELLISLDPFTIALVLIAMLNERRIIFVARKLSTLSSCVQGCVALLHPFSWQHVFIPVLPVGMIQFVCAPVPFVVGLLASHLDALQSQAELMDEVLLIDVENSCIVPPTLDYRDVPEKYFLPLVASIARARTTVLEELRSHDKSIGSRVSRFIFNGSSPSSNYTPSRMTISAGDLATSTPQNAQSIAKLMESSFISFFASTLGDYNEFLSASAFDKDAYIKNDPALEKFKKSVAGSQLFEQFILHRQANSSRIREKKTLAIPSRVLPKTIREDYQANLHAPTARISEVVIRAGWLYKFGKGAVGAFSQLRDLVKNDSKDKANNDSAIAAGTFQKRHFRLSYFELTYHKEDTPNCKPQGRILLLSVDECNLVEFRGVPHCLEIKTPDRIYQATSENTSDLMYWMELINWRMGQLRMFYSKSATGDAVALLTAASHNLSTSASTNVISTNSSNDSSIANNKMTNGNAPTDKPPQPPPLNAKPPPPPVKPKTNVAVNALVLDIKTRLQANPNQRQKMVVGEQRITPPISLRETTPSNSSVAWSKTSATKPNVQKKESGSYFGTRSAAPSVLPSPTSSNPPSSPPDSMALSSSSDNLASKPTGIVSQPPPPAPTPSFKLPPVPKQSLRSIRDSGGSTSPSTQLPSPTSTGSISPKFNPPPPIPPNAGRRRGLESPVSSLNASTNNYPPTQSSGLDQGNSNDDSISNEPLSRRRSSASTKAAGMPTPAPKGVPVATARSRPLPVPPPINNNPSSQSTNLEDILASNSKSPPPPTPPKPKHLSSSQEVATL